MILSIEFLDKCPNCNFDNKNIWGTIVNDITNIDVRCIRCGKPLLIDHKPIPNTPKKVQN